jgi:hypothetical protein
MREPIPKILLPLATVAIFVAAWHFTCETRRTRHHGGRNGAVDPRLPTPRGIWNCTPISDGTLMRFAVASIYRSPSIRSPRSSASRSPWAGVVHARRASDQSAHQALRPISPIA